MSRLRNWKDHGHFFTKAVSFGKVKHLFLFADRRPNRGFALMYRNCSGGTADLPEGRMKNNHIHFTIGLWKVVEVGICWKEPV